MFWFSGLVWTIVFWLFGLSCFVWFLFCRFGLHVVCYFIVIALYCLFALLDLTMLVGFCVGWLSVVMLLFDLLGLIVLW